jgi:hypothetical protein
VNREPVIGTVVHYVTAPAALGGQCRAAIVTEVLGRAVDPSSMAEVDAWCVSLTVLHPLGMSFESGAVQSEDAHDGHTWHWAAA